MNTQHTAGRRAAIWKLDSESLAYAAIVSFYTRDPTTSTAFGSLATGAGQTLECPSLAQKRSSGHVCNMSGIPPASDIPVPMSGLSRCGLMRPEARQPVSAMNEIDALLS